MLWRLARQTAHRPLHRQRLRRCRLFSDAEEIAAEKILEQAAARAEKGFQRGNGAFLLAHQLAVVIVTQQHGGEATIEIGFHPRRGGLAADLTLLPGHADAPWSLR